MKPKWTEPFHGVQHLGEYSMKQPWVTVSDHGTFAELSMWFPGCGFSPHRKTCNNAEEARRKGERWLSNQKKLRQ